MGIRSKRSLQLAKEVTAGTAVFPPTIQWRGEAETLLDTRVTEFVPETVGLYAETDRTRVPMLGAELTIPSQAATFEQLPIILAGGIKNVVTGTSDGSGTGMIYAYPFATSDPNTITTFTVITGDDIGCEYAPYVYVKSFGLSGKSGEALQLSANLGGRFVVQPRFAGTVSYVNATKKITAASGLDVFKTGMTIRTTGSSDNSGPFTVATGNVAAEIVISESPVEEAGVTGSTVKMAFTPLALPTVEDILVSKGKLYLDASSDAFGTTQVTQTLLGVDVSIVTGQTEVWCVDGNNYFTFLKQVPPEISIQLTFEHNSSSAGEKEKWRLQTPRRLRLRFDGTALTTAGTTYTYKALLIDVIGKWEQFDALSEQDGNDIVTATFRGAYNATEGLYSTITVVNEVASF